MAKRWTPEEDELLLQLRKEGFTTKEMTLRVERSEGSIRMRLAKIATDNLKKPWTQEEKDLAVQLKREGKSNKHIAYTLGRSNQAISSLLHRLGI